MRRSLHGYIAATKHAPRFDLRYGGWSRWATLLWQLTWLLILIQCVALGVVVFATGATVTIVALVVLIAAVFGTCLAVPCTLGISIAAIAHTSKRAVAERREVRIAITASIVAILPWIIDIVVAIVVIAIWRNDIRIAP